MGSHEVAVGEGIVGSSDSFVLMGIGAHFSSSYSLTQNELIINTKI